MRTIEEWVPLGLRFHLKTIEEWVDVPGRELCVESVPVEGRYVELLVVVTVLGLTHTLAGGLCSWTIGIA